MIIKFSETFNKWLKKLKDSQVKTRILKRLERISNDNFGDIKSVGASLYEIRIDYGQGYRIYFTYENNKIIILLCAGDKSTQEKDIKKAKEMLWKKKL